MAALAQRKARLAELEQENADLRDQLGVAHQALAEAYADIAAGDAVDEPAEPAEPAETENLPAEPVELATSGRKSSGRKASA